MSLTIDVQLPADRTKYGRLQLLDSTGAVVAGPFDAYGKADNLAAAARGNPTRDPTQSYGDTPTGNYRGYVNDLPRTPKNDATYGPQGVITLDPVSGQALTAKQNGRFGLLIHGGAPSAAGKLRPTFGCIRVANASMTALLAAIPAGQTVDVTVTQV